jgi:branched-chain amino acid transport system substrate-binding protein
LSRPLVASLLPHRGPYERVGQHAVAAIDLALEGSELEHVPHDESDAEHGGWTADHSRGIAHTLAADERVAAVVGPFHSGSAVALLPVLNRARLAAVSPSNTYAPLTIPAPGFGPDEPDRLYPTGRRTYARLIAHDLVQGAALATLARELGLASVAVLHDGEPYGMAVALGLERAARAAGLEVAAMGHWDGEAADAEALVLCGAPDDPAALAAHLRGRRLLASDGFVTEHVAASFPDLDAVVPGLEHQDLPPAGVRFVALLAERLGVEPDRVDRHAAFAAQASLVARAALEQSDGTRAGAADGLLDVEIAGGLVGGFRFDPNGDPVAEGESGVAAFTLYAGTAQVRPVYPPAALVTAAWPSWIPR